MTSRRPLFRTRIAVLLSAALSLVACAAENTSDPGGVKAACESRLAWKRANDAKCTECKASARLNKCDCPALTDYSGKCADEGTAVYRETSCTDAIETCVETCKNDCACVDHCYANAPNCKAKTGALDSCVVSVCSTICE